jgi:hypothetical protein
MLDAREQIGEEPSGLLLGCSSAPEASAPDRPATPLRAEGPTLWDYARHLFEQQEVYCQLV